MTGLERNFTIPLSALADLLMPRRCVACGKALALREKHLCTACAVDLPRTRWERMSHNPMADKLNALIERDLLDSGNVSAFEPYQYACALFLYHGDYARITRSLKYHGNFGCGKHFADMLGESLARSPLFADVDLIIPVPLHWSRRWRRGFNQAEVIASAIGKHFPSAKVDNRLLRRIRRTESQVTIDGELKSANVEGAFGLAGNALKRYPPGRKTATLHVLLVDDVYTTGSTLNSCRRELRKIFGPDCRISGVCIAYAG